MLLFSRVRRFALLTSIVAALLVAGAAPVAAADPPTQLQGVLSVAHNQKGDPWKHYAKGPDMFDCVGFVWFAFNQNGLKDMIGGYRGVGAYYNWFKERGLVFTDASQAKPGDMIIWGQNKHIGIYLGPDQAISALINPYGVSVHPIRKSWIGMGVKGYLRVDLER